MFALGEHHNPPFFSSSPTTTLGVHRRPDQGHHPVHGHDAHHDQRPGQDRRGLRDAPASRGRPRRPDDGPRQHRPGVPLVRAGHPQRHPAGGRELRPAASPVARGRRRLAGTLPDPADRLHLHAPPARRHPAVRVARLHPQPRDRGAGRLLRGRLLPQQHLLALRARAADGRPVPPALRALRPRGVRPGHRGSRWPGVHARRLAGGDPRVPARTSTTRRSTAAARRSRTTWTRPR